MATLTELYSYVRTQTQTTPAELPDTTIKPWLQQGMDRTVSAFINWPFLETQLTLTQTAGQSWLPRPSNLEGNGVVSLIGPEGNKLRLINQETAERAYAFAFGASYPVEFSIWGNRMNLWPPLTYDDDRTYNVRGFVTPTRLDALTPADRLPIDDRLHYPVANYAVAMAYLQQEDEVLEVTWMTRWQRDVEIAASAIMKPANDHPVEMGPRYRSIQPGRPFIVIPPDAGSP